VGSYYYQSTRGTGEKIMLAEPDESESYAVRPPGRSKSQSDWAQGNISHLLLCPLTYSCFLAESNQSQRKRELVDASTVHRG
jgi:hypothetical protein